LLRHLEYLNGLGSLGFPFGEERWHWTATYLLRNQMPHWLSRLHSWQRPQISHLKAYGWAPLWRAGKSWDGRRMLRNWKHPKIIAWQTALLDGHCVACLRTAARTGGGNVDGARLKAADSEPQNWLTLRPTIIFC